MEYDDCVRQVVSEVTIKFSTLATDDLVVDEKPAFADGVEIKPVIDFAIRRAGQLGVWDKKKG